MRVVAGALGGRKLSGPPRELESTLRPTTDRVREAMFNALSSLGYLDDVSVADVFAGTGACGIEALSRGAERATFVDSSRRSCELINANLESLDLVADVVCSDAVTWAKRSPRHDLVIADPPYGWTDWDGFLSVLDAGLVVCEDRREVSAMKGWKSVRVRKYGQTVMTFLEADK